MPYIDAIFTIEPPFFINGSTSRMHLYTLPAIPSMQRAQSSSVRSSDRLPMPAYCAALLISTSMLPASVATLVNASRMLAESIMLIFTNRSFVSVPNTSSNFSWLVPATYTCAPASASASVIALPR